MTGRPPTSTRAERERVYALTDAGLSSRAIAERVFGDRRLKDRVLRLLRRRAASGGVDVETATPAELRALFQTAIAELERVYGPLGPGAQRPRSRRT